MVEQREAEVMAGGKRRREQQTEPELVPGLTRGTGMYSKGYTLEVILPEEPVLMPVGRYLRSRIVN